MNTTYSSYNEIDLANRLKKQDRSAMRDFYSSTVGYLTGVRSRYIPDNDVVKDILQEAYIKIFKSIDKFQYRGAGSLKAWVTRIVVNDCLKSLKKKKNVQLIDNKYPDIPDEEDTDPGMGDLPMNVILDMIRSLPDGYRTVFNLFVFENKSHKEIASLLGIKENSSASQYFRARMMLVEKIEKYRKEHR